MEGKKWELRSRMALTDITGGGAKKLCTVTKPKAGVSRSSVTASNSHPSSAMSSLAAELEMLRGSFEENRKNMEMLNNANTRLIEELSALRMLMEKKRGAEKQRLAPK
uniref:Uncharacterized protein n=1 Tax=Anopheles maculatus TaxID=74869 RepID=A0A182T0S4_9DIPT